MSACPLSGARCASALLALVAALALALGACGGGAGGGDDGGAASGTDARPPAPTPSRVDPAAVRVVRAWADTLRRGDVAGAASYFALPAVVANGTQPLRLLRREAVLLFNRSLPCGARLVATEPTPHGFLVASFRLTERPGAGTCGNGSGGIARVAIGVRDGRIAYWVRVTAAPRSAPAPQSQATPA